MKPKYREWLEQLRYSDVTVNAQVYRAERVEKYYGDLDGRRVPIFLNNFFLFSFFKCVLANA